MQGSSGFKIRFHELWTWWTGKGSHKQEKSAARMYISTTAVQIIYEKIIVLLNINIRSWYDLLEIKEKLRAG